MPATDSVAGQSARPLPAPGLGVFKPTVRRMSRFAAPFRARALVLELALLLTLSPRAVLAQGAPVPVNPGQVAEEGLRRAQERAAEQRQARPAGGDALRPAVAARTPSLPADETPCFAIDAVELRGTGPDAGVGRMGWLLAEAEPLRHRCLGARGLGVLVETLNQRLLELGYATSRVLIPPQNLALGTLQLQLHVGRVEQLRLVRADGSADAGWGTWRNAFPLAAGDTLDLRALEQGVEQMKRLPSQRVTTRIEPGDQPDTSVVLIARDGGEGLDRLRGGVSLDNSGGASLGRTQLALNLALDNPLGINDIATVGFNTNAEAPGDDHHSQSLSLGYSVPWGWSLWSLNATRSRFAQRVQLTTTSVRSSGSSRGLELQGELLALRTAAWKLGLSTALGTRRADGFLDDSENLTQRRRTTQFTTGLNFKRVLEGGGRIEFDLAQRRGMPWLEAEEDRLVPTGGPTVRPRLVTASLRVNTAVELAGRRIELASALRGQRSGQLLLSVDQLAIGGRGSVRGFDGDSVLIAESGWVWRNEASLPVALDQGPSLEPYVAVDAGRVWGRSDATLVGRFLAGAAVGLRAHQGRWHLDAALAAPLRKPAGFQTARLTPYLSLTYSF